MLPPCFATQPSFQCRALGNVPEQSFMICSPRRQGLQSLPAWLCHHHLGWHLPNINIGACPSGCKVSVQSHPLSWLPEQLQTVPAAQKKLSKSGFTSPSLSRQHQAQAEEPNLLEEQQIHHSTHLSSQPSAGLAFSRLCPTKKKTILSVCGPIFSTYSKL